MDAGHPPELGELRAGPRTRIVLIRNRIDAQTRNEARHLGGPARVLDGPQRLGKIDAAAPDCDPERPRIGGVHGLSDETRSVGILALPNSRRPIFSTTGPDLRLQGFRARK